MANWAELSQDLLQLVAQRLPLNDYVNFAKVCTSWQTVAMAAEENYNLKTTRAPWLIAVCDSYTKFYPFYGPRRRRNNLLAARGCFNCFCSQGWIVKGGIGRELTLYNPLSRAVNVLPALEEFRGRQLFIEQFAMSSSPSQSNNYNVMICFYNVGFEQQIWAYRSEHQAWTRVKAPHTANIERLIHCKGQFVALDSQRQILTLDDHNVAEGRFVVQLRIDEQVLGGHPVLVECSGSLLVVDNNDSQQPRVFGVFEVDLVRKNWRELKSLGNASLFLNMNYCSFSMNLSSSWALGMTNVKPNCIYFKGRNFCKGGLGFHMEIYHMDDEHIEQVFVKLEEKWSSCKFAWIQPRF